MSSKKPITRRPLLLSLLVVVAICAGIVLGLTFAMHNDLPEINRLEDYKPNVVTSILDKDGRKIAELYKEKRIWISFDEIPEKLKQAIIATEDTQFFQHKGVRLMSILRALLIDIRKGRMAQGGSTITQQLTRQLFLTPQKHVIRKIREALLAIQIEKQYTKREIFELYANQIYLGSGAYGVESAARIYFGKSAPDLNLEEAALIAGLPQAPSRYSPFVNPDLAKRRRDIVLGRMGAVGNITEEEKKATQNKPVRLVEKEQNRWFSPYFVDYVRQHLLKTYGEDRVYREGLVVTTTLDSVAQRAADIAVTKGLMIINNRIKAKNLYQDEAQVEAALIAIRPSDGAVVAMVGGSRFAQSQFNRALYARRQPGSAFKPFVYLAALNSGFSPGDIIIDSPVVYKRGSGKGYWKPSNFSNKFYGPVTLRTALERSMNVAAIKLQDKVGIQPVIDTARSLGIKSPLTQWRSLALGASVVTPIELTAAYATFANNGLYSKPYFIESVVTSDGEVLEKAKPKIRDAIRPEVAFTLTNMLRGVVENGTGKAAKALHRDVAGKTGTTNSYNDAWFAGYTPQLAATVWTGFDDNRSMGRGETGGRTAAPIWTDFMSGALRNKPSLAFTPPQGIVIRKIDRQSGKLATHRCEDTFEEVFVEGTEPTGYCKLELQKNNNF